MKRAPQSKPGLELRPVVDAKMDADAAWLRASVEAFEPRLRELEGRGDEAEGPTGPPAWETRPDLGCGWGCDCCESPLGGRNFLDLDRAPERSTDRLRTLAARAVERAKPLVLGAAADPYGGSAEHRALTHSRLQALRDLEGAEVVLTTASPLVLVDLDLLVEIDQVSSLSVEMVLPTVEPGMARRLEPGTPPPAERLSAISEIADQGIVTRLRAAPLLPGLTDDEAHLRPWIEAASAAGVTDVAASPLSLPSRFPTARRRALLAWIEREEPDLAETYRRLYRLRRTLRPADRRATLATFERLRLEYGFPRATTSRG